MSIEAITNQNGYQKIAVIADDGTSSNNTASQYFELTVNAVNDPPDFDLSKNTIIMDEDSSIPQSITVIMGQNPVDEISQSFTYSLSPASSDIASVTINENTGEVSVDAIPNQNGYQAFEIIANDGELINNLSSESFELTINAVNDPPAFELSRNALTFDEDFTEPQTITIITGLIPDDEISQSVTYSLSPTSSEVVSITINENSGQITIEAISNQNGNAEFLVIANDGMPKNSTAIRNFALTINSVNDPPDFELSKNSISVDEDFTESQSITIIMGLIPDDETEQSITFSLSPASSQIASFSINENTGQVSITAISNQNGSLYFTVIANDGMSDNNTAIENFVLTINAINDLPEFSLSKNSIIVDEDFTESLSITAIMGLIPDDETTQSITFSLSPASPEIVSITINENTGQFTMDALSDLNGYQKFEVTANDNMISNNIVTESFELTINSINDAPVFDLSKNSITVNEDFTEPVVITITQGHIPDDETTQAITYSVLPAISEIVDITINENTGELVLTSIENKNGTQAFTVTANDSQMQNSIASASFDLTINSVNDSPVFALSNYTITVDEDFTTSQTINVIPDYPPEDEISQAVSYSLSPSSIEIADIAIDPVTGKINIQASDNQNGSQVIDVIANDSQSQNNIFKQRFKLIINPINDPPTISAISDQTILEDAILGPLTFIISDIESGLLTIEAQASNITALPAQNITFCAISSQSYSLNVIAFENNNLTLTIAPLKNINGDYTINLSVTDSQSLSDSTTFNLLIQVVNDAPVFEKGSDINVLEDCGTQVVNNWIPELNAGADNESSQNLSFYVHTKNDALFASQPSLSISGSQADLRFTPKPDLFGSSIIDIYLEDDGGTDSGGTDQSRIESFTLTVMPVNDPPEFTIGSDQTVFGGTGQVQTVHHWASGIKAGPANESTQNLQFHTSISDPSMFVNGQNGISISDSGTLTYSPTAIANSTVTVTVYVSDSQAENYSSSSQYFNITVKSRNREPTFSSGPDISVNEDAGEQTIQAWATSVSPGESNELNQTLSFQIESVTQPGIFTSMPQVIVSGTTGILKFTTAPNAHGSSHIILTLRDDGGTEHGGDDRSPSYGFDIDIVSVNDSPSFIKGSDITVKQNSGQHSVVNWATQISRGPADENTQSLTFHVTNNSNPGIFSVNPNISSSGDLVFTPANTTGTSEKSIHLADNGGGNNRSATQTFAITVDATAPPEISAVENQETAQDTPTDAITLTVNDEDTNENNLIITATSSNTDIVVNSKIAINGSGNNRQMVITPTAGEYGSVTITISADDGNTASSTKFALTVHPKPSASIGIADEYTITGAAPLAIAFSPTQIQHEVTDWLWDFGDGTTSDNQHALHSYQLRDGEHISNYTVKLTVSGPGGSSYVQIPDYVKVHTRANVDFVVNGNRSGSKPFTVSFTNQSDVYNSASVKWYFGDGITDTTDHPTHTYTQTGKYSVVLEVTDLDGNKYTKQKAEYIEIIGRKIAGAVYHDTLPLENMIVEVWQDNILYGTTTTQTDGTYTLNDLPSLYRLIVAAMPPLDDIQYLRQYYLN